MHSGLTDIGPSFSGKVLQTACIPPDVRNQFTITYSSKENEQAKRYNRTLGSALTAYVRVNDIDCNVCEPVITFEYNTQVHRTMVMRPFDFVIARDISALTIEQLPLIKLIQRGQAEVCCLNRAQVLVQKYTLSFKKSQARYKRGFDRRLRVQVYYPEPGSYVFCGKATWKYRRGRIEVLER